MRQVAVRVEGVMTSIIILVVMHRPNADEDGTSFGDQHSVVVVICQKLSYGANVSNHSGIKTYPW